MRNKIIGVLVSVAICIIVVANVLTPIVNDASAQSDTFYNDGYFNMSKFNGESVSFEWTPDEPEQVTVNGVVIPLDLPNFGINLITGDDWFVRYWDNTGSNSITLQTFASSDPVISANTTTAINPFTVEISNGSAVATSGDTTVTYDFTELYYISPSGDYVMKNKAESVYLRGDSELNIIGTSVIGGQGGRLCTINGSINDGLVANVIYPLNETFVVGDVVANSTQMDNHVGLYELSSIQFTVLYNDATNTLVYDYFVVPASVEVDRSEPLESGAANLISILPLFVIMAVLIMAVAAFFRNRY